jgi:hypothetical protein
MKNSGTWDDETMAQYLRSPREVVPGGKMAFPGLKDDAQIANLLAIPSGGAIDADADADANFPTGMPA